MPWAEIVPIDVPKFTLQKEKCQSNMKCWAVPVQIDFCQTKSRDNSASEFQWGGYNPCVFFILDWTRYWKLRDTLDPELLFFTSFLCMGCRTELEMARMANIFSWQQKKTQSRQSCRPSSAGQEVSLGSWGILGQVKVSSAEPAGRCGRTMVCISPDWDALVSTGFV